MGSYYWRRIRDPGIKPRIFILIIFDAYYWGIDDNLEQLVLDIFHDGFLVNDKSNYIIGVVYCRKREMLIFLVFTLILENIIQFVMLLKV